MTRKRTVISMSDDRVEQVEELALEYKIPKTEADRLLENMEADV